MRISDWSSDVCSSDLPEGAAGLRPDARPVPVQVALAGGSGEIGGHDEFGRGLRAALSRSFSMPDPCESPRIGGWQSARLCAKAAPHISRLLSRKARLSPRQPTHIRRKTAKIESQ